MLILCPSSFLYFDCHQIKKNRIEIRKSENLVEIGKEKKIYKQEEEKKRKETKSK